MKCKHENAGTAMFCPDCGKRVNGEPRTVLHVRVEAKEKAAWVRAAGDVDLSVWVRGVLNAKARAK